MTRHPEAADGSLLAWNHEDHFVVSVSCAEDGTRAELIDEAAFQYRDGTAAMALLKVGERVAGRWVCVECRLPLPDDRDICPCTPLSNAAADDPF